MEPLFNFVWLLVSLASISAWFRRGRRTSDGKRVSLVGLAMLVLILFPVISVSDDLWSLQNPAESDSYQRRDHHDTSVQSHFPASASLPESIDSGFIFGTPRKVALVPSESIHLAAPAFGSIQNRPPPVI